MTDILATSGSKAEENKTEDKTKTEPEEPAAGADAGAENPEEKVNIYDNEPPNRIIIGRNHPLSFYVERARRVFRIDEEVHVTGRGDNIAAACKLVEALKRQQIAKIEKISTGMNVEPYFNAQGDARWGPPSAVITFKLTRGELAEFISDYQQRKVIEIFEKNDEKCSGVLSLDKVKGLELPAKFKANEEQTKGAEAFIGKAGAQMNLPEFIKYASILIHPLLKTKVFKEILTKEFGIEVSGQQRNAAEDDE